MLLNYLYVSCDLSLLSLYLPVIKENSQKKSNQNGNTMAKKIEQHTPH